MNVMQDITIDVLKPRQTVIHVVQEDSTRKIRLTLLKNNLPFDISQDLDAGETVYGFVEFRKADGHGGMYDTTSLGDPAVELEDAETATNVWIVNLDGNCFTCPGWAQINVRFETEDGKRIHTFRIMVDVEPTASSDTESTDWGELNSIADLRNAVAELAIIVENIAGNTGLTEDMKQAFLACFENVGWKGTDGREYVDALEAALYPPAELLSISAVFEQGETVIYDTDSLDDLKPMLTVTAHYTDGTSEVITTYTLSGTLTEGTSTITVSYGGKTATFDVVVQATTFITGYTSIGAPRISGNEFTPSTDGYIQTTEPFDPGDDSWAIRFKVYRGTGGQTFQNIFRYGDTNKRGAFIQAQGSTNKLYLSSDGTSNDIANGLAFSISDNTTKFIEIAFDGNQTYTARLSDDGETWTIVQTVTSTKKIYIGGGNEIYVMFGAPNTTTSPYQGKFFLDTIKIYIGGELWWQAKA